MTLVSLLILSLAGVIAGVLAGLLGIGGGLVLTPFMTFLFAQNGFSEAVLVHMAVATALSTVIFTSLASTSTHHHHGAVDWPLMRRLVLGMMVGAWLGPQLSSQFSGQVVRWMFVAFTLFSAYQIGFNKKPQPHRSLPGWWGLLLVTVVIGFISSVVGAGGGALTVPFLLWCNVDMRRAVGCAAGLGFPIALVGTLANIFYGWGLPELPPFSLGFVYVPALVLVLATSMISAYGGARLAQRLPVLTLRRIFAVLLLVLASYMVLR